MKNILFYALLIIVLAGCKKENDPVLEDPDKRLIEVLADYKTKLTAAPDGWKAFVYPNGGGGYFFHFKFDANNNVVMYSDIDTVTAITAKGSSWRLKALQQPTLMFDTYNYIHVLSDPDETKNGGTRGKGLRSDFEFSILRASNDSILGIGNLNLSVALMAKATAAEAKLISEGRIKVMLKAHADYLKNNANPYLLMADGKKLQVNFVNRTVTLSWVDANSNVLSVSSPFAINLTGITFGDYLKYGSATMTEFLWDDVAKKYYVTINGIRTNIENGATPVIPFMLKFGPGKEFNTINVTPASSALWSPEFTTVWNTAKAGLAAVGSNAGRIFDNFYLNFSVANEMSMRIFYRNAAGSAFQANFMYSVTWVAPDRVKLTFVSRDGNANTAGPGIVALTNYLEQNEFIVNWGSTAAYGGLYKATAPASFLVGTLSKL